MSRIDLCYATCCIATQNVAPPYLVSKVSSAMLNIWIVPRINLFFIRIILMMDQMSSGLHGVEIKLNTAQPKIVWNFIKMQITPELST